MGRKGCGGRGYVYTNHHVDVWQKPAQYCKVIIVLQLENNFYKNQLVVGVILNDFLNMVNVYRIDITRRPIRKGSHLLENSVAKHLI